jgi:hypothetical protein
MFLGLLDPEADPSINKQKINKNLDFYCSVTLNDFLFLKTGVNVPTESNKQIKETFFFGILEVAKRAGSGAGSGARFGSVNQVYRSKDPDPYQNVTDPEHCLWHWSIFSVFHGVQEYVLRCLSVGDFFRGQHRILGILSRLRNGVLKIIRN